MGSAFPGARALRRAAQPGEGGRDSGGHRSAPLGVPGADPAAALRRARLRGDRRAGPGAPPAHPGRGAAGALAGGDEGRRQADRLAEGADPSQTTLASVYSEHIVQLDSDDPVDKAIELMRESERKIFGSWELWGDTLFFVIKLAEPLSSSQLNSAILLSAEAADEMEKKLSGARDDF